MTGTVKAGTNSGTAAGVGPVRRWCGLLSRNVGPQPWVVRRLGWTGFGFPVTASCAAPTSVIPLRWAKAAPRVHPGPGPRRDRRPVGKAVGL